VIAGPRRLLGNRWIWAGAVLALALWSPWLWWQTDHGWPQLEVSRSIAEGGSTSSEPWWSVLPFQFLLVSPVLAPVWIAGLVVLYRDRELRFLAWAWGVLALTFMATGGKPYYLAGLFGVLLAAGAVEVDGWLARGSGRVRSTALGGAVALSGVVSMVIALPLLPAAGAGPVIEVNEDVGETIGWPELARTVATVVRGLADDDGVVVLARNYGEAGAIDRFGPALGLPRAYSGHNAYGDWGPPPDDIGNPGPVVAVGLRPDELSAALQGCTQAARIDNDAEVDNQERGRAVMVCRGPRGRWSEVWPALRHLG